MASENIPIVFNDSAGVAYLPKHSLSLRMLAVAAR